MSGKGGCSAAHFQLIICNSFKSQGDVDLLICAQLDNWLRSLVLGNCTKSKWQSCSQNQNTRPAFSVQVFKFKSQVYMDNVKCIPCGEHWRLNGFWHLGRNGDEQLSIKPLKYEGGDKWRRQHWQKIEIINKGE